MFRRLASLPADWTVLHSLGLARHDRKPWSEIDFTVVGPLGVLLIEVKGGVVGREAGEWRVRTVDGRVESLGRGPFQQVGGAEAATRRFIEDRVPGARLITFGYAVATPDCRLEVDDLGVDCRCVIDARHVDIPVEQVVASLLRVWADRTGRREQTSIELSAAIVDSVCGDIAMAPDLRRAADDVEQRMVALTIEQQRAVADLSDSPALWLAGPAGSGKTMLAVNELRRCRAAGLSVMYLCHTRALAEYVRSGIDPTGPKVLVSYRHQILRDLPAEPSDPKVGVLIVDEGQDLMDEEWLKAADTVLEGGLAQGRWRVFIDPNQALFAPMDRSVVATWMSHRPAVQRLSKNCRSTRPISLTISALTGVPFAPGGVEDGPTPELLYVDDSTRVADLVLQRAERLIRMGIESNELVVLTPRTLQKSCLADRAESFVDFRQDVSDRRIRHATVGAFKGLESKAVILAGVDEIASTWARQQLYVGCSRSTVLLEVVLPVSAAGEVARGYGKATMSVAEDDSSNDEMRRPRNATGRRSERKAAPW